MPFMRLVRKSKIKKGWKDRSLPTPSFFVIALLKDMDVLPLQLLVTRRKIDIVMITGLCSNANVAVVYEPHTLNDNPYVQRADTHMYI